MKSLLRRGSGRAEEESAGEAGGKASAEGAAGASSAGPVYPFDSDKKRKSLWLQKEQVDRLKQIASERGYRGMSHLVIDTFDLNEDA